MTATALKEKIIKKVSEIEDIEYLEDINSLIHNNFPITITPEMNKLLDISLQQIEQGRVVSHEEVMKKLEKKYGL